MIKLQARGLSAHDVSNVPAAQNLILPVGTKKIDQFEYSVRLNNAVLGIAELGNLLIKFVNGSTVFVPMFFLEDDSRFHFVPMAISVMLLLAVLVVGYGIWSRNQGMIALQKKAMLSFVPTVLVISPKSLDG